MYLEMNVKKGYFIILYFCLCFVFTGCNNVEQREEYEAKFKAYKLQIAEKDSEIETIQGDILTYQEEIKNLQTEISELTRQLQDVQEEFSEYKEKISGPDELLRKYERILDENEYLRKMAEEDKVIIDQFIKKIEQDQNTIRELKSRLEE